ncbi:hypothetical protein Bbelb_427990 [Branchiostoma belcheri]|nr:hypothetical protein Bbelb_427990 [Branchiostoma belcheri]
MAAALLSSTYVRTNQQARLKAQQTEDIAILTSLSVMHLVVFSIIAVGLRFTDTERREYNLPDPKFICFLSSAACSHPRVLCFKYNPMLDL